MKKFVVVSALAAGLALSGPAASEERKVPKMDESKIVMSTQSSEGNLLIPLLLLVLLAVAISSSNGGSHMYPT